MFAALDLSPILTGTRVPGDVLLSRPLLYGMVPPSEFVKDSVDGVDSEEQVDDARPESALLPARIALGDSSPPNEKVATLIAGLTAVLDYNVSCRERLQLWYCLRSLGVKPDGPDSTKLMGVVFEFHHAKGYAVMGVYADKSASGVWDDGAFRWASYEEGEPRTLIEALLSDASVSGLRAAPIADCPHIPTSKEILVSYLYPSGVRYMRLPLDELAQSPHMGLFSCGKTLFACLAEDAAVVRLDLDLDDPQWKFANMLTRSGAFLVDIFCYAVFFGLIYYFTRDIWASWDFRGLLALLTGLALVPPFLSAWMESSPSWGFRTLGKQVFGLVVYSLSNAGGPTFSQALARNLSKWFISPLFCSCGILWAKFHRYHRGWHDVLSHTVVLHDPMVEDAD